MYTDHKFIRSSVTWAYRSVDNCLWRRKSQKRVECFSKTCYQEQFNLMMRLENVLKIFLQDVLKTSWRCLEVVFASCLEDVSKTSWKLLEDVWPRRMYWSWPRRLEDVLKTCSEDVRLRRTYSSWSRRLEDEDERRLQDVIKTSSSRQMFAGLLEAFAVAL